MSKKKPPVKKAKKITASKKRPKYKPLFPHIKDPRKRLSRKQGAAIEAARVAAKHAGEQMTIPDRNEAESIIMTEITNVKKLTTKIIVGKKIGKIEARTVLYSIIGVATGLKTGESNYGAWTGLLGRFEAERTADGAMFSAPLVLLPDEALSPIVSAVRASKDGVEFALIVSAEPTLSAPGYVYDIASVVAPRRNDMLAGLRNAMQAYISELRTQTFEDR
jgi:hypothetical protein